MSGSYAWIVTTEPVAEVPAADLTGQGPQHAPGPATPAVLLVAEHPDDETDVEAITGPQPELVRFNWALLTEAGRFAKGASLDDTLDYVRHVLGQLADPPPTWPQAARDRLRGLLAEAARANAPLTDSGGREYEIDWEALALRPVTADS